ncbi:MAG TPA: ATP-binding protein [Candidatus Angelobacter sp.]
MLSYTLENSLMLAVFQLLIAGLILFSCFAILRIQEETRKFLGLLSAAFCFYCVFSLFKVILLYRQLSASALSMLPENLAILPEALQKAALVLLGAAFLCAYVDKKPVRSLLLCLSLIFVLLIGIPLAWAAYGPARLASIPVSGVVDGLWLAIVAAIFARLQTRRRVLATASLTLLAAAQILDALAVRTAEGPDWLWTTASVSSLTGLGLLAMFVESRSANLPIRFFLRLNLIFIAVASLLIAIVAEMERSEYLSLAEQNTQELVEYLRGQVIYSSHEGIDPREVLSSSELIAKVTADFARLSDLRRVRMRYRDWGMEMAIGDDWLISHQVYRAAGQVPRPNRAGDRGRLATLTPISIESRGTILGTIEVDESLLTINSQIARHMRIIFLTFTAAVFIAAGLFGVTVQYAHRTIQQQFQELETTNTQLLHAERLASVGQLAGGFAHEINNPAGIILTTSDYLLREVEKRALPENIRDGLQAIRRQACRVSETVNGLLTFARPSQLQKSVVSLNSLLTQSLLLLAPRFRAQQVRILQAFEPDLPPVSADPHRLEQVFVNLLNNAADAMPDGGEVKVETMTWEFEGSPYLLVSIADSGVGIPKENLEAIFHPFFSTKAKGKGTGLGLSVSHGIVRDHGGSIEAESILGQGAIFRVYLPVEGDQLETI